MPYDVAFRHQQALDPSALVTIGASLHAITRAIDDCRNAGIAFETDPAVILLARHLASVTARQSEDALLKRRCMDRIAELRQHPALLTLAVRGVAHEALLVLKQSGLAGQRVVRGDDERCQLGDPAHYDLRSNRSHASRSGEITLHGEELWMQLSLHGTMADREVIYRRVSGRHDHLGERDCYASIRDLLAPERFAVRLRKELRLTPPVAEPVSLFG